MSDVPPPLPSFASWPTFPFEGDLRVKKLDDPVDVEPPRHGEDPAECSACRAPDGAYIWVSERWRVRALDRPTGLPMVLILESRSHLDLGDLPNLLAAELGVLTVRLERAIRSLDGVARVHVNRWGDGSAHLHMWFLARPSGRLQLRGTFLSLWDDILPRVPEGPWRENLALIAAWLAEFGGEALAEPPHIDWQSPAMFTTAVAVASVAADDGAAGSPDPGMLEQLKATEYGGGNGPSDDPGDVSGVPITDAAPFDSSGRRTSRNGREDDLADGHRSPSVRAGAGSPPSQRTGGIGGGRVVPTTPDGADVIRAGSPANDHAGSN